MLAGSCTRDRRSLHRFKGHLLASCLLLLLLDSPPFASFLLLILFLTPFPRFPHLTFFPFVRVDILMFFYFFIFIIIIIVFFFVRFFLFSLFAPSSLIRSVPCYFFHLLVLFVFLILHFDVVINHWLPQKRVIMF